MFSFPTLEYSSTCCSTHHWGVYELMSKYRPRQSSHSDVNQGSCNSMTRSSASMSSFKPDKTILFIATSTLSWARLRLWRCEKWFLSINLALWAYHWPSAGRWIFAATVVIVCVINAILLLLSKSQGLYPGWGSCAALPSDFTVQKRLLIPTSSSINFITQRHDVTTATRLPQRECTIFLCLFWLIPLPWPGRALMMSHN